MLGQFLNIELSKQNQILTLYNSNVGNCNSFNSAKINITDSKQLKIIFENFRPNAVVHAAAISTPDTSAISASYVSQINMAATKDIAGLCAEHNSKLIFTSTDLVYDGDTGSMLKEDGRINPVSLYAETKLAAENQIKNTFDNFIILRTALLYGFGLNHSTCHFQNMFNNLKNNQPVKLFADQYRTPLSIKNAAEIINRLVSSEVKNETINFGGKERVSRFELGEILCMCAGLDKNLLVKSSMGDLPNYPQVADVSMNTVKLNSLEIKQKTIEESVKEFL